MRFKPTRGLGAPNPSRAATNARLEALGEKNTDERVFDVRRHESEIRKAENRAAGLPEDAQDAPEENVSSAGRDQSYRSPDLARAEDASEDDTDSTAAAKPPAPKGIFEKARAAVKEVVKKVRRLIKPEEKLVKEVIINAEPLETRVAVLDDSKL
jgi:hypothetical protein